jgi:hypothetical protein
VQTALREAKAHPEREEELMRVARLEDIPGFNIDRVAAAAGDDPDVFRMENLDTDIRRPKRRWRRLGPLRSSR